MVDELELLKRESPHVRPPSPGARLAARQALEKAFEADGRRRWRLRSRPGARLAWLAPIAALSVVVVVVAVFLGVRGQNRPAPTAQPGSQLVFRAEPSAQVPVMTRAAVNRAVAYMRARVAMVLGSSAPVSVRSAGKLIFVHVGAGVPIGGTRLLALLGTTARLMFYDWERNVLTPAGSTAASRLVRGDPAALRLSQGGGTAAPGSPGAGSMSLYAAVRLAARQPESAARDNGRLGPEYFEFGAPGSAACRAAAEYYHVTPPAGQRCYLAGPEETLSDLYEALPAVVTRPQAQVLVVPQGTVVLHAAPANYTQSLPWSSPGAEFYVLRDRVALFGNEITNPEPSTDASGQPVVEFQFTGPGAAAFHRVTGQIARRGAELSTMGQALNQHFAVVLETQLLSVPSIDFRTYPDGVTGNSAVLAAGLTRRSAQALAAQLREGAMPINLRLISFHPG